MKSRLHLLSAIGVLLWIARAHGAELPSPSESIYKDKPLVHWLKALESGRPASAVPKQAEAEEAIHALGPEMIPLILRYNQGSRAQRLDVIRHACGVLGPDADLKLTDALKDPDPNLREMALEVLPDSAIPLGLDEVIRAVADPVRTVRGAAIRALIRLAPSHEETVVALIAVLHDKDAVSDPDGRTFSREDAALALSHLGQKAKVAIAELTDLLSDPKDEIREAAAIALWKIDKSTQVVPTLVDLLESTPDYQVGLRIMKLLGEMGPIAKAAVPVLQKKIDDPGVRFLPPTVDFPKAAWEALNRIDSQAGALARKKLETTSEPQP